MISPVPAQLPPTVIVETASAVPGWLQVSAAVGTVVAALVGSAAAFGAIRAANAARAQAKDSTEAANRALEALGRVLRPEALRVQGWIGPQPNGDRVEFTSPTALTVRVDNFEGPAAAAVTVTVTPSGGQPRLLTPSRVLIQPGEHAMFQLSDMPLGTAEHPVDMAAPHGERQATAEHLFTVEYADLRELLRWRQVFHTTEVLTVTNRIEGSTSYPDRIAFRSLTGADPQEPELIGHPSA